MKAKIGDILEIPLKDGRQAYGQYVYSDKRRSDILYVYDFFRKTEDRVDLKNIINSKLLFYTSTFINSGVKLGVWNVIRNLPIKNFTYPGFISSDWDKDTGEATMWFYLDSEKWTKLGKVLPKEYKDKELSFIWSPFDIVERIETGKHFYQSLVTKNKLDLPKRTKPLEKDDKVSLFDDDDARDLLYGLEDKPGLNPVEEALKKAVKIKDSQYLDSSKSSEALMAAEVVAGLSGNLSKNATETFIEITDKLHGKMENGKLETLKSLAIQAVERIKNNSELKDLWRDSKYYTKWVSEIDDLLLRLRRHSTL